MTRFLESKIGKVILMTAGFGGGYVFSTLIGCRTG
jgi:hypothetical protein